MSAWVIAPTGLIEPAPAIEIYADGIGAIEYSNGNVCVFLVREQLPLESANAPEQKVVVAKITGPVANVPAIIGQLAQCLLPRREALPVVKPRLVT